jgi:hypothetical protein
MVQAVAAIVMEAMEIMEAAVVEEDVVIRAEEAEEEIVVEAAAVVVMVEEAEAVVEGVIRLLTPYFFVICYSVCESMEYWLLVVSIMGRWYRI